MQSTAVTSATTGEGVMGSFVGDIGAFDDVGGAGIARAEESEESVGEVDISKVGEHKSKYIERDGVREVSWESWNGRVY